MRKGPAPVTVALAPPGRLTEPYLPAMTAAPQPVTLSVTPDLHPYSHPPLLPLQPSLCPTVASGSSILASHSPAQIPPMAPHCPRLRSERPSLAPGPLDPGRISVSSPISHPFMHVGFQTSANYIPTSRPWPVLPDTQDVSPSLHSPTSPPRRSSD